jgi:carbonic anhydrase
MKSLIKLKVFAFIIFAFTACNKEKKSNLETEVIKIDNSPIELVEEVLTKEQQEALSPDDVIKLLKNGNVRFTNNDLTARNHSKQVRNRTLSQYPKAIVLSCADCRVPVEDVFDRGIGDLFVARVVGNFVNEDILGSMEFACVVSGSKLVLVMGHEHCGAIKAAIDHLELGNITPMLQKIMPALERVVYNGERNAKNQEFVHMVCEGNVRNTIAEIRLNSPLLKGMEDRGEIKIVGSVYAMDNGEVNWLE